MFRTLSLGLSALLMLVAVLLVLRIRANQLPTTGTIIAVFTPTPTKQSFVSVPTWTPVPTSTPTVVPPATDTPFPLTALQNANLRQGPGTHYAIGGSVRENEDLSVRARTRDGTWLELENKLWIYASLVYGDLAQVPVAQTIPVPSATSVPVSNIQEVSLSPICAEYLDHGLAVGIEICQMVLEARISYAEAVALLDLGDEFHLHFQAQQPMIPWVLNTLIRVQRLCQERQQLVSMATILSVLLDSAPTLQQLIATINLMGLSNQTVMNALENVAEGITAQVGCS